VVLHGEMSVGNWAGDFILSCRSIGVVLVVCICMIGFVSLL
jgi:hypothetical protein